MMTRTRHDVPSVQGAGGRYPGGSWRRRADIVGRDGAASWRAVGLPSPSVRVRDYAGIHCWWAGGAVNCRDMHVRAGGRGMTRIRTHKYGAVPTVVDGIRFASKKEARRYSVLRLLEKAG